MKINSISKETFDIFCFISIYKEEKQEVIEIPYEDISNAYGVVEEYASIEKVLNFLAYQDVWSRNGKEHLLVQWMQEIKMHDDRDIVEVSISDEALQVIEELRKLTNEQLETLISLKTFQGKRLLYYIFANHITKQELTPTEILHLFGVEGNETYRLNFFNLRNKIIDVAIKDINRLTEFSIEMEIIKTTDKKIKCADFYVKQKPKKEKDEIVANRKVSLKQMRFFT